MGPALGMAQLLQPAGLADRTTVVEFRVRGGSRPSPSRYCLIVKEAGIDLCLLDPHRDVDLCVEASLKALTEVWMGDRTMADAVADGSIDLLGPPGLTRRFLQWLGRHPVLGAVPVAVCT